MPWFVLMLAVLFVATPALAEPIIIAHRGQDGSAPENTLAAFRGSIARGITVLEADVRVTRDGELVLIHDATVNRTTNGRGRVASLALADIRKLDAGSGERVPTLREALQLVRGTRTSLLLDMKPGTPLEPLLRLVRSEQAEAHVIFGLRSAGQAQQLRQLAPAIRAVALLRSLDDLDEFENSGLRTMRLWSHWIDPALGGKPRLVGQVRARGHAVWCVVGKRLPRSEEDWRDTHDRLTGLGCEAITTDRPDLAPERDAAAHK
jgi:glycerophosphoryl diester phosphodiesterase